MLPSEKMVDFIKYYIPVLIYIGIILFLSGQQSGSFFLDYFPVPLKLGHLIGYAGLQILMYRAINKTLVSVNNLNMIKAFIFTVGFAIIDETYQTFVPTRSGSVVDVIIDSVGALTGLVGIWLINHLLMRFQVLRISRK
ncbi:VanZ family protein [Natranaerobius trueperi]|uniref:VanZ-like domain-containing protein n=1 Tax=Natranaerobius trueperi TaxID=759412 RepID=A0A226C101_9FIRM|nr:VanZ family protein [Natranaerobius trueperi]OWZ84943.1 hypothetical protein CDO51_00625 [Natranaerobius trueperi]